jgi:hypothetical protein
MFMTDHAEEMAEVRARNAELRAALEKEKADHEWTSNDRRRLLRMEDAFKAAAFAGASVREWADALLAEARRFTKETGHFTEEDTDDILALTIQTQGRPPKPLRFASRAEVESVAEMIRDEYAPRVKVVVPDKPEENALGSRAWLLEMIGRVLGPL